MRMAVRLALVVSLMAALAAPAGSAMAQHRGGPGAAPPGHAVARAPRHVPAPRHIPGHGFVPRHGFIGHAAPHHPTYWRSGRWVHSWHNGRYGWWWALGSVWYLYPEPIYPYPLYPPPTVVIQTPPPTANMLPPAQYWYFCDDPAGYYPYVAYCNGVWHAVPAISPGP